MQSFRTEPRPGKFANATADDHELMVRAYTAELQAGKAGEKVLEPLPPAPRLRHAADRALCGTTAPRAASWRSPSLLGAQWEL
jgi:hypothetical protein